MFLNVVSGVILEQIIEVKRIALETLIRG